HQGSLLHLASDESGPFETSAPQQNATPFIQTSSQLKKVRAEEQPQQAVGDSNASTSARQNRSFHSGHDQSKNFGCSASSSKGYTSFPNNLVQPPSGSSLHNSTNHAAKIYSTPERVERLSAETINSSTALEKSASSAETVRTLEKSVSTWENTNTTRTSNNSYSKSSASSSS
ncbi:unnamed protein product, partial [Amoebophrya sp. A25]